MWRYLSNRSPFLETSRPERRVPGFLRSVPTRESGVWCDLYTDGTPSNENDVEVTFVGDPSSLSYDELASVLQWSTYPRLRCVCISLSTATKDLLRYVRSLPGITSLEIEQTSVESRRCRSQPASLGVAEVHALL